MNRLSRGRLWGIAVAVLTAGCSDEGGGASATDAGRDGFTLIDTGPDVEAFEADPPDVAFEDVAVGETDVHSVNVVNRSTSPLRLTDIDIVQSDNTVTFANVFLGDMTATHGWRDIDGDRQTFETREGPITVIPGGSFAILVQYRPDGGLLDCLDRAPAPCGLLRVTGETSTLEVELFVPRGN